VTKSLNQLFPYRWIGRGGQPGHKTSQSPRANINDTRTRIPAAIGMLQRISGDIGYRLHTSLAVLKLNALEAAVKLYDSFTDGANLVHLISVLYFTLN
jgi:hypothetical protein